MYELSHKQQNIMNEIENAKQEWAMDQTVILSTKLNKMKEKNDLIQRENDILKTKEQEWKIKENDLKTKENVLNSKLQGISRKNKTLKRVLQGKRVDRISSNPWRWNSRVKRLSRLLSALSTFSFTNKFFRLNKSDGLHQ
ncbi:hypothetical protein TNCV_1306871 [Trichonephila clavipes]|nr:hypothetical protein TNCV_1306871 [Trichonephila clavipes]